MIKNVQTFKCCVFVSWTMHLATLASSQASHLYWKKQIFQINITQLVGSRPVGYLQAWWRSWTTVVGSTEKQLWTAQWSERDLNPPPPDFKSGALTTGPTGKSPLGHATSQKRQGNTKKTTHIVKIKIISVAFKVCCFLGLQATQQYYKYFTNNLLEIRK